MCVCVCVCQGAVDVDVDMVIHIFLYVTGAPANDTHSDAGTCIYISILCFLL